MAGIKDIAKMAGVSISTVSYALNGSPKVTEETRSRIMDIAKELEYTPNGAARMLKTRSTKIVGVFLSDYSGSFYGQLLKGMRETLGRNGYEFIICSGQSHRLLLEKIIDGGIILDESFSSEELINYANKNYKLVVLDRELSHKNIRQVLLENEKGVELAMQELLKNNYKTFYAITGPKGSFDSIRRKSSVRSNMSKIPDIDYKEIQGDFNKESGEKAAKKIIEEYTEPVAVFCFNDEMAIGMYNYLKTTEFKIGTHIKLVGFDNIELSDYMNPKLTTIGYSKYDWGSKAAEAVINLIEKQQMSNVSIDVHLVEGSSS